MSLEKLTWEDSCSTGEDLGIWGPEFWGSFEA